MILFLAMIDSEEDKTKFEYIYTQYRQLMFYIAKGIIHNDDLAEDAVQQAFLRIIDNLQKINDPNCPQTKSYVVIIVKHAALDMIKQQSRHRHSSFEEIEENGMIIEDLSAAPDGETDYQILISSIQSLPQNYTDILLLKYVHGYSVEEISGMLNLSVQNIRKILQRARNKLEQKLRKEGEME